MKGFQAGQRWRKLSLKTGFRLKLKLFAQILGRQWIVVKKGGGGIVAFTFYSVCQSLWGSSPAVNSIPNSIDSQDDSSEAHE